MRYLSKYLSIGLIVVVFMAVGCKVGPSVLDKISEDKSMTAYVVKSGTSRGGGPVVTGFVIRDNLSGEIIPGASFYASGPSTGARILEGAFGIIKTAGPAAIYGMYVERAAAALRPDQETTTISNSGSNSSSNSGANSNSESGANSNSGSTSQGGNGYGGQGGNGGQGGQGDHGGQGGHGNYGGGGGNSNHERHNHAPGHYIGRGHTNHGNGRGVGHW